MCNVLFQMDKFVVIKFCVDNTVALICKKWISEDAINGDEVCCISDIWLSIIKRYNLSTPVEYPVLEDQFVKQLFFSVWLYIHCICSH